MTEKNCLPITLEVYADRVGPILARHPWIFSRGLKTLPDGLLSGTPVKIIDERHNFLAWGYFNSYSQIAVRVWGYEENEKVNEKFFIARVQKAWRLRQSFLDLKKTNAFRLINSENDFLPGLIVDKYGDYLVLQCHTKGIAAWKKEITAALQSVLQPKGIYERTDVAKNKENTETSSGVLSGNVPDLIKIKENGFSFFVDVKEGQKTGFFLDQRDKRQALLKYAADKTMLNCFCYSGGFSVYALAGKAAKVTNVDISQKALDLALENIKLNKFDLKKCEFICADGKQYLRQTKPSSFDLVVLDPPAFIKDRKKKNQGLIGYKNINESALRILKNESLLISCSCSNALSLSDLRYIVTQAGASQKKNLQVLEAFTFGPDHPQLSAFTETEYLKVLFVSVSV